MVSKEPVSISEPISTQGCKALIGQAKGMCLPLGFWDWAGSTWIVGTETGADSLFRYSEAVTREGRGRSGGGEIQGDAQVSGLNPTG